MRFLQTLALVALLGIATPAPAARGVASASIVVPVVVAVAPASGSLVVSVASIDDGVHEHVTVAYN
jgi:hypothetical protein